MKILAIDTTDQYNPRMIIEATLTEFGHLPSGLKDRREIKAGDTFSLKLIQDGWSALDKLRSTNYHKDQMLAALSAMEAVLADLGLTPKPKTE